MLVAQSEGKNPQLPETSNRWARFAVETFARSHSDVVPHRIPSEKWLAV